MSQTTTTRFNARFSRSSSDRAAAQALRHRCFRKGEGVDADAFDARCAHLLIEDRQTGRLVGCCRLLSLKNGAQIGDSYSAQFYDLTALGAFPAPMVELGRFCIAPDAESAADILRLAWAMITRQVERAGVGMLFGCTSFKGTDASRFLDVFSMLHVRHSAPKRWQPGIKASQVIRFADCQHSNSDNGQFFRIMPPLLRSYLAMGGWVSDHAVVDHDLNTLHVFTGLEVGAVPPARARLMRAMAKTCQG